MSQAYEVPLHELLEKVPADARLVVEHADGYGTSFIPVGRYCKQAAIALRAAIEQAEKQEPVAWKYETPMYVSLQWKKMDDWREGTWTALYTAPPQREIVWCDCGDGIVANDGAKCGTCASLDSKQREWQGLTDEEVREFEVWLDNEEEKHGWNPPQDIIKYIEAKLKEKNT